MHEFAGLSDEEERIATAVVDCAFCVHSELGPGLLENIYERCLQFELEEWGFRVERQLAVPIRYREQVFDEGFRLDLLMNRLVFSETKAVTELNPVFKAQILSHLKLMNLRLGFLINFHVSRTKDGIQRFIR